MFNAHPEGATLEIRRRLVRKLKRLKPWVRPTWVAPYVVLSTRPPIIHCKDWAFMERPGPIWWLLDGLRDHEVHLLYGPSQHLLTPFRMKLALHHRDQLMRRYPRLRFTTMADSEAVADACAERRLSALFANNNALVDERIYRPLPEVPKTYDAVYDAKLEAFKRHELAAQVESLALISYVSGNGVRPDYADVLKRSVAHAHRFNDPLSPRFRKLDPWEVNEAYNRCRVGLCLSAREGTMRASVQYLLAGLPVISTESEGGRDEFFHPDYVRIVPADPHAVAEGVRDAISNVRTDATEIRRRTVGRMEEHRRRLFGFVNDILRAHGEARRFEDDWPQVFVNHLEVPALVGRSARGRIDAYNRAIIEAASKRRSVVALTEIPDHAEFVALVEKSGLGVGQRPQP